MFEFDPVIRAMGLYKYIIYFYERSVLIEAIRVNAEQMKEAMIPVMEYKKNMEHFAKRLQQNKYRWDGHQER